MYAVCDVIQKCRCQDLLLLGSPRCRIDPLVLFRTLTKRGGPDHLRFCASSRSKYLARTLPEKLPSYLEIGQRLQMGALYLTSALNSRPRRNVCSPRVHESFGVYSLNDDCKSFFSPSWGELKETFKGNLLAPCGAEEIHAKRILSSKQPE